MRKVLVFGAVLGAWLGLVTPSFAVGLPGDALVGPDTAATDLSGFGGVVVWSHQEAKHRHALMLFREGRVERLPVSTSKERMDADVGPGPDGTATIVYRKCRSKCRIYSYSVATGKERRLRIPSRGKCGPDYPAVSGASVAFALVGERCGRRRGVWLLTGRKRRQVARADAVQVDVLNGRVVWIDYGSAVIKVRLASLSGKSRPVTLFADGQRCCGFKVIITSPAFDGTSVYWGDWNDSGKPEDPHRLYRASGAPGAACEASDVQFPSGVRGDVNSNLPWIDYAVSGTSVFYSTPEGVFQHPVTAFLPANSKYPAGSKVGPGCGP